MTDPNPFRPNVKRRTLRFMVEVHGTDVDHKPTRTMVGQAASFASAMHKVVDVLQQWSASHGAIHPGTRILIVDINDGGRIFAAEYLGFEETLI